MRETELWELQRMPRRFSIPPSSASDIQLAAAQQQLRLAGTSEDLHAWSIYRQVSKILKKCIVDKKVILLQHYISILLKHIMIYFRETKITVTFDS